jgi:hypothetical protein
MCGGVCNEFFNLDLMCEVFIVVNTKAAVFRDRGNRFVRNVGMPVYQTTRRCILEGEILIFFVYLMFSVA